MSTSLEIFLVSFVSVCKRKFVRYIVTQIIATSESGVRNFHVIRSLVGVQCLKTLHMSNKSDITVVYFSCLYLFYCAKVHNSHASNTSKTGTHAITLGCDCNYNIFLAHCKLIYMQHHRTHDLQTVQKAAGRQRQDAAQNKQEILYLAVLPQTP